MTVYAITDTKKGRTGIAPTYLHTTQCVTRSSTTARFTPLTFRPLTGLSRRNVKRAKRNVHKQDHPPSSHHVTGALSHSYRNDR